MSEQSLGDRLKAARSAAEMTQEALATRSGLSKPYISMIEGGSRGERLSFDAATRLAAALNVDVAWLMTDVEPLPDTGTFHRCDCERAKVG